MALAMKSLNRLRKSTGIILLNHPFICTMKVLLMVIVTRKIISSVVKTVDADVIEILIKTSPNSGEVIIF